MHIPTLYGSARRRVVISETGVRRAYEAVGKPHGMLQYMVVHGNRTA